MDIYRIVEISDGKETQGSGYALTFQHVLTCWHVVSSAENPYNNFSTILLRPLAASEADSWKVSLKSSKSKARVVWHSEEFDIALLEIIDIPDKPPNWNPPAIGTVTERRGVLNCTSVGFPSSMATGLKNDTLEVKGEIHLHTGIKEKTFNAQIISNAPREAKGWGGFSGSGVFIDDILVGIVTKTNLGIDKNLVICPLDKVVTDEKFCQALGNDVNLTLIEIQPEITAESPDKNFFIAKTTPIYAEKLKIRDRDDLEKLSAFFIKTIEIVRANEVAPISIFDIIHDIPIDGSLDFFFLSGGQGTGKTAFLSVLYTALKSKAISQQMQRYPLFLSVDNYINLTNEGDDKRRHIDHDIRTLQRTIEQHKNKRFVLIVDGITSRENMLSEIICERVLWNFDFKIFDAVLWSMADGFEESLNKLVEKSRKVQKGSPPDFKVKQIKICPIKIEQINPEILSKTLKDFIFLQKRIIGDDIKEANLDQEVDLLAERLKNLNLDGEIDQHTLSLIYEKMNSDSYFDNATIATFLQKYCIERLNDGVGTENRTISDTQIKLREAAWLAYRIVVGTFYSDKQYPKDLRIEEKDKNTKYWNLVFQHANIRDFLVAWYLLDLIGNGNSGKPKAGFSDNLNTEIIVKDRLGYDFPQVINAFMRYMLDGNSNFRNKIVDNIEKLLKQISKGNFKQLSQTSNLLYYLLGRCSGAGQKPGRLLENAAREVEKKLEDEKGESRIQFLTQYRTISISLIRLGNSSSSKFLLRLLSDKQFASIDRGYHRLYYDDTPYFKDKIPNCYLDDTNESWSKSFESLKSRIDKEILPLDNNTDLDEEELDLQKQHYVFTLVSFVQSRIRKESSICTKAQKVYALKVINCLLNHPKALRPNLRHYFSMIKIDLEQGDLFSSRWRFILDLYRLKWEPRRGWLSRELQKEFWEGRIESVADHSYMTLLLATFLLPEQLEEIPDYQREAVIRKLIFHDVAEAYTGDFIHHLLGENKEEAKAKEWDALMYLRYKDTYAGLNSTQTVFEDSLDFIAVEGEIFADTDQPLKPSVNAKFARDIDKLENLIQLFVYRDMYPKFISCESFQSYIDNLIDMNTDYVKKLADGFIKWAESQQGNILHWSDNFFEESLLQKQDCVRRIGGSS